MSNDLNATLPPASPSTPNMSTIGESAADRGLRLLEPTDTFVHRHIGPSDAEVEKMLALLGLDSLESLVEQTVPASIRHSRLLELDGMDDPDRPAGE